MACYDAIYKHSSPYTENKHEKHQNGKSSDQDSNGAFYEHDLQMLLLETVGFLIYRMMQNLFETRYLKKWFCIRYFLLCQCFWDDDFFLQVWQKLAKPLKICSCECSCNIRVVNFKKYCAYTVKWLLYHSAFFFCYDATTQPGSWPPHSRRF